MYILTHASTLIKVGLTWIAIRVSGSLKSVMLTQFQPWIAHCIMYMMPTVNNLLISSLYLHNTAMVTDNPMTIAMHILQCHYPWEPIILSLQYDS